MTPSWPIYAAAIDAYKQGKPLDSNPYPEGTRDYYDWNRGWNTAEEVDYYNGKKTQANS